MQLDLKGKLRVLERCWAKPSPRDDASDYDSIFEEPVATDDEIEARGEYCVEHLTKANAQVLQV